MKELHVRIMGLENMIEKNIDTCKKIKVLAGACLFLNFCFCYGSRINSSEKQVLITAIVVWILSMLLVVVLYFLDTNYLKKNKQLEFKIYDLENEDMTIKTELAEFNGKPWEAPENTKEKPSEEIKTPLIFYIFMLMIDIIIGVSYFL